MLLSIIALTATSAMAIDWCVIKVKKAKKEYDEKELTRLHVLEEMAERLESH